MATGTPINELAAAGIFDEIIGNYNGSTVTISTEEFIALVVARVGPSYASRNDLYADLDWSNGAVAGVFDDITSRNGIYVKLGLTGSGSWSRIGDLPLNPISVSILANKLNVAEFDVGVTVINRLIADEAAARQAAITSVSTKTFFAGYWDASSGAFPVLRSASAGGGSIENGDYFEVSIAGTVDGKSYASREMIRAYVDNPSTTDGGDWFHGDLDAALTPIVNELAVKARGYDTQAAFITAVSVGDQDLGNLNNGDTVLVSGVQYVKAMGAVEGIAGAIVDDWEPSVFQAVEDLQATSQTTRGNLALWYAEGYAYQENTAGGDSESISTASGLTLYALPNTSGVVSHRQLGLTDPVSPSIKTIRRNDAVSIERFGVYAENVNSGTPYENQTDRMQDAFDASFDDGIAIMLTAGTLGVDGGLTLRTQSKIIGTVDQEMTRIVNADPYTTTINSDQNGGKGVADVTLRNFGIDGGWDRRLNGVGKPWDFAYDDAAFDNIYGLNLYSTLSSQGVGGIKREGGVDTVNYVENLFVTRVAGTGIRRAGRGGGYMKNIKVSNCARYGIWGNNWVDDELIGFDIGVIGGCPLILNGNTFTTRGKLWFTSMCRQSDPLPALIVDGNGSVGNTIKHIVTQDTGGVAVSVQGRAHDVDVTCLETARLETGYLDQNSNSGYGPQNVDLNEQYIVRLAGANDCTIKVNVNDRHASAIDQPVVGLLDIQGSGNTNNTLVATGNNSSNTGIKSWDVSRLIDEPSAIPKNRRGNWVYHSNGAILLNGNLDGLNTLRINDSLNFVNFPENKGEGTVRWLNDIRRNVVASGSGASDPWLIDGTDTEATTVVIREESNPATITSITVGDRYLVGDDGSSGFNNKDGQVATYRGPGAVTSAGAWDFIKPIEGHTLENLAAKSTLTFDGDDWS